MALATNRIAAQGLVALLLAAVVFLCGCPGRDYKLVNVSGTVTLDDKPLEGGHVTFQPMAEGNNRSPGPGSVGVCDENGRYSLRTVLDEQGAVIGKHQVKIRLNAYREMPAPVSDVDTQPIREMVPPWYNDNTILEFTVPPKGTDQADFDLSTKRQ